MNFLIASFLLLIFSYLFLKKTKINLVVFGVFVFLYSVISVTYIISNYFTGNWVDESVIYHLFYWLGWAWFWADAWIIILWAILLIIWIALPIWFYYFWRNKEIKTNVYYKGLFWVFFISAFIFHPIFKNIYDLWYFDLNNVVKWKLVSKEDIEKVYFVPEAKKKTEKTKNIIYLYLESFEKTYLDEEIFPNLTPNLNKLRKEAISFENLKMAYWTSWTIAWMVWSQCWSPLINSGWWGNSMHWIEDFLPWAFCLWDFLKKQNYNLSYIWWANLSFAWKWNFYKTHSFDNILWREKLEPKLKNKDYINDWWLYDDSLFDFVFEEYERLSETWQNFWLFTLNLDTHWSEWVISESCKNYLYDSQNEKNILNSYHCVDKLVWELVEKIRNHKNFKNTTIVITSDHYAMKHNNSYDTLEKNKDKRRNLFLVLDSDSEAQKIEKEWSTLDIWASILNLIWFDVDKLWAWVNLFSNLETNSESYLKKNRNIFESFWSYPSLKNWIDFDLKNKKIKIEWKDIQFPALIYLSDNWDTKQILWTDDAWELDLRTLIKNNSIFIDYCEENKWFCLNFKTKYWENISQNISENKNISYEEILQKLK